MYSLKDIWYGVLESVYGPSGRVYPVSGQWQDFWPGWLAWWEDYGPSGEKGAYQWILVGSLSGGVNSGVL